MLLYLLLILQLMWCITAAPQNTAFRKKNINSSVSLQQTGLKNDDLKTAASSYSHQYSNWGGNSPGGYEYSVTGYGFINNIHDSDYGVRVNGNTLNNIEYPGYTNTGTISNIGHTDDAWTNGYNSYKNYARYNPNVFEGNGGYGGYGGNGGLNAYNGYNNPYYQGSNHLGYGYYNKQPGFGNIYNGGITPSLVTGYRGYTRR